MWWPCNCSVHNHGCYEDIMGDIWRTGAFNGFVFCTCYGDEVLLPTIGPDVLPQWLHQPVSVTLGNGSGDSFRI